nr:MAG TPA: tail tape measure protein [Caudoviricetes sp.]
MAKQVKVEITADSSRFEQAMQGAAKATSDAGAKIDNAGNKASNAGKKFDDMANRVKNSATKVDAACGKASKAVDSVNKSINAVGAVQVGDIIADIATGIVRMGVSCIKASGQMRQYEIAFQTMLKSANKGTQMMKDLQKFAADTPFNVPGVVQAGQQLMAFGFKAKEIIPTLRTLGDAASGLGKGTAGVQQIAYAMGQIRTSGTLKTQDIMQLTNAGIDAWGMLAEASGKSILEIKEMTERGMIDSLTAVKVLTDGMNDTYGGMMAKTAEEITGLCANIEETVGITAAVIGDYLVDGLDIKAVLKSVGTELGNFTQALQAGRDAGKSFTDVIKDSVPPALVASIAAVGTVLGTVLVGGLIAAAAAMATFIGVSLPVIGALGLVGAAIGVVVVYWDELVQAVTIAVNMVLQAVIKMAEGIVMLIHAMADGAIEMVGDMFNKFAGYCPEWVNDLRAWLNNALKYFRDFAQKACDFLSKVFKTAPKEVQGKTIAPAEEAPAQKKPKGTVNLSGLAVPKVGSVGSGGSGGSRGFGQLESEVNRVSEALTRAGKATKDLQEDFDKMNLDIATAGLNGSDQVFAKIDQEKQARMKAVDEMLSKQLQAVQEAEALRASAERTGNAESIAKAKALYDERNALYAASLAQEQGLKDAIDQQAYEKSISLETALQAAKADMNAAFNEQEREKFLEYLNSEQEAKMVALQQEQELRQQLLDWRMESQQNMLDFELQAGEAVKNQLASGIADVITEGGKLSDVFKDITKSIVNMFIQFMVKKQAAAALEKLLGKKQAGENAANSAKEASAAVPAAVQKSIATLGPIGGPPAYTAATTTMNAIGMGSITGGNIMQKANGGPVFGAGTGTSDSIPAMLSNGEYVINAKAVRRLGLPLLNALNNGYAIGGVVSSGGGSGAVVEFNNYGDINNGTDYDGLMADFEYTLAMGMRG